MMMSRTLVYVTLLLFIFIHYDLTVHAKGRFFPISREEVSRELGENEEVPRDIVRLFYELWRDTNFGHRVTTKEESAWLILTEDGEFGIQKWPPSSKEMKGFWKGPLPDGVVAQVHTHPPATNPAPSNLDLDAARAVQIPFYTISRSGIWKVTPEGKITQHKGLKWYDAVD